MVHKRYSSLNIYYGKFTGIMNIPNFCAPKSIDRNAILHYAMLRGDVPLAELLFSVSVEIIVEILVTKPF